MQVSQKITPFLSFESRAEEAANFYVSVFKDASIIRVLRTPDTGPGPPGSVLVVDFQIAGMKFAALNVGQDWKFTDAISLLVNCESQQEVDEFWEKLSDGGEKVQCGWLRDKFGVSWQVAPTILLEMIADPDREKAGRVMQAMMQMTKIEIQQLQQAYDGR